MGNYNKITESVELFETGSFAWTCQTNRVIRLKKVRKKAGTGKHLINEWQSKKVFVTTNRFTHISKASCLFISPFIMRLGWTALHTNKERYAVCVSCSERIRDAYGHITFIVWILTCCNVCLTTLKASSLIEHQSQGFCLLSRLKFTFLKTTQ